MPCHAPRFALKLREADGCVRAVTLSAGADPVAHRPKIHEAGYTTAVFARVARLPSFLINSLGRKLCV